MTSTISVDANFVRQQLKKHNLTTNFLAALGGFADRGMVNYYLRQGRLPVGVVRTLSERFNIELV